MTPNLAIIGPAGTGKTRFIADFIERELPRSALILTFARGAAREISERVAHLPGVYVHTAHSAAMEIVFDAWRRSIDEPIDSIGVLAPGAPIQPSSPDPFIERARGQVKATKKSLTAALRKLPIGPGDMVPELRARMLMKRSGVVTPDDLIELAIRCLAHESRDPWDVVLIDEGQDASDLVWRFFDAIVADYRAISGDDAQELYAFAGADVGEFRRRIASADEKVVLSTVWRSCAKVVDYSAKMREQIENVEPMALKPGKPGGHVKVVQSIDAALAEAQWMAGEGTALLLARSWREVDRLATAAGVHMERPDLRFGNNATWAAEAAVRIAKRGRAESTDAWIIMRAAGIRQADAYACDDTAKLDEFGAFLPKWWSMVAAAEHLEQLAELFDSAGLDGSIYGEGLIHDWSIPDIVVESDATWVATTVHQSKGREADAVIYLAGIHDTPQIRHVAASRAREMLWVIEEWSG